MIRRYTCSAGMGARHHASHHSSLDILALADDRDILIQVSDWADAGHGVALAFVLSTWGSAPRPVGSLLAICDNGEFEGSVSGGCVENAVIEESNTIISNGEPRTLSYGVTDETAWELGLPCGGTIEVLALRLADQVVADQLAEAKPAVLIINTLTGASAVCRADEWHGTLQHSTELQEIALPLLESGQVMVGEVGGTPMLFRPFTHPYRLLIVGAVHIAQPLAAMAQMTGFDVTVIDPRRGYATSERFPDIRMVIQWPDTALTELSPDNRTAVVTLSHDVKLDDPALEAALASPAFYIGALGSRRNHAKRLERLAEQGISTESLARIQAPVGLNIGGNSPSEIALSVLAQITAARYHKIDQLID